MRSWRWFAIGTARRRDDPTSFVPVTRIQSLRIQPVMRSRGAWRPRQRGIPIASQIAVRRRFVDGGLQLLVVRASPIDQLK